MRYYALFSVSLVSLSMFLAGCSQESTPAGDESSAAKTPAVTLVNTVCPMMGGPVDQAVTVEWNGKTVGFCCASCIPGWEELSDEEKASKLAAAAEATADQEHETMEGHEHDHDADASPAE